MPDPVCPYCGEAAVLKASIEVYGKHYGSPGAKLWVCTPCDARVGCHRDTDQPLGTLAGPGLRLSRAAAHRVFDPVWKDGTMGRSDAYAWLASVLGIEPSVCHIGSMDDGLCRRVVEVCTNEETR